MIFLSGHWVRDRSVLHHVGSDGADAINMAFHDIAGNNWSNACGCSGEDKVTRLQFEKT